MRRRKDQNEPNHPILTRTSPRSRTGRHHRAPNSLQQPSATRLFEVSYWAFAPIQMPNDGTRLSMIRALIGRGHLDQIAISQDICRLTRLHAYGGHGYGHILRDVVPLMRETGFSDGHMRRILMGTPRRLLTIG